MNNSIRVFRFCSLHFKYQIFLVIYFHFLPNAILSLRFDENSRRVALQFDIFDISVFLEKVCQFLFRWMVVLTPYFHLLLCAIS